MERISDIWNSVEAVEASVEAVDVVGGWVDAVEAAGGIYRAIVLGGAATCSEGFVIYFLKVPLACLGSLGSMAAAVQPNSLGNSQKKVN